MNESRRVEREEGRALAQQIQDTLPVTEKVRFTVIYEPNVREVARFRVRRHNIDTVRREGGASETP